MSLSDAYVEATCDGCHAVEVIIPLTATTRNGWDERYVKAHLESIGWLVKDDGTLYCENCQEEN